MKVIQTNLSEVIEELLKPELYPWDAVKSDGKTTERFEPLTLPESPIESEMDFSSAAQVFDSVREKLRRMGKSRFIQRELESIVVDTILDSGNPDSINWLRNHKNIFGPDIDSMTSDQGYVYARNAGELRNYITQQMC